jgi:hypothetical protein
MLHHQPLNIITSRRCSFYYINLLIIIITAATSVKHNNRNVEVDDILVKSEEHISWEMPIDNFMAYIQSYKYSGIIHKKNGYYEINIDILTKELFPKNQV